MDDVMESIGAPTDEFTENGESESSQKRTIERVHRDDFHRICSIGKGAYADVQMVADHKGEYLALKALKPSRIKSSKMLVMAALDLAMEAKILSELNHEIIICLRGISSATFSDSYSECTDDGYFIVQDLLKDILSERLRRWRRESRKLSALENKWSITPKMNIKLMYERMQNVALGIVRGMIYLHEQGIVLRDLKPSNVGFDGNGNVRLFDFGMARKLEDCDDDEVCGSPRYMAPEAMYCRGYSFKTDVYSFGIILFELCSLTIAFNTVKRNSKLPDFFRFVADHNLRPNVVRIACPLTVKLVEDCWQSEPEERPSFDEIYRRIADVTLYGDPDKHE